MAADLNQQCALLALVQQEATASLDALDEFETSRSDDAKARLVAGLARIFEILKQVAAGEANLSHMLEFVIVDVNHAHHWLTEGIGRYYDAENKGRRFSRDSLTRANSMAAMLLRKLDAA